MMSYGANQEHCCEVEPEWWTGRKRMETPKRPAMLGEVVPIYDHTTSEKPDRIRVSFDNGTTAVYVLDVEQPHPMCVESIRIIRKWNGYNNQPMRRRRKP
jgi:hypothetical protein